MIKTYLQIAGSWLRIVVALIITLFAWQYIQVKVYRFPAPSPFKGNSLYNPYDTKNGEWLKGNFHAHSKAWAGITNGKQAPSAIVKAYMDEGYDIAGLSNYQQINDAVFVNGNIGIPAYEHGLNITKTHQLVIGGNKVTWFNIMLWQNTNTRQYVIERLQKNGGIISINHPFMNNGHTQGDFNKLTGYDCLEVINRDRVSGKYWDEALSAGIPSWILADDDCHDINGHEFLRAWTLVKSKRTGNAVMDAIRSGRTIGVCRTKVFEHGEHDSLDTFIRSNKGDLIDSVVTNGLQVRIKLKSPVKTIVFSTDHGMVIKSLADTNSIDYTLASNETYVRAVIETDGINIYLNPFVRYDGKNIPFNPMRAETNGSATFFYRLLVLLGYLVLICLLFSSMAVKIVKRSRLTKQS